MGDLHEFVTQRIRGGARTDFISAGLAALGGALVVAVSYFVTYGVLAVLFHVLRIDVPNGTSAVGAALFIVLVFVESWRSQRKLLEGYSADASLGGALGSAGLYMMGVGWGPNGILPLSPGAVRNSPKVIADLLFSGPRLLRNSVRLLRRARVRRSADLTDAARVLDFVYEESGRVTLAEIASEHPDIDLPVALEHLGWLEGVIYLRRDPPGLTLSDALRAELEAGVEREDP